MKTKENLDVEESLSLIWTSIQRGDTNFNKIDAVVKKGVCENVMNQLIAEGYVLKDN